MRTIISLLALLLLPVGVRAQATRTATISVDTPNGICTSSSVPCRANTANMTSPKIVAFVPGGTAPTVTISCQLFDDAGPIVDLFGADVSFGTAAPTPPAALNTIKLSGVNTAKAIFTTQPCARIVQTCGTCGAGSTAKTYIYSAPPPGL